MAISLLQTKSRICHGRGIQQTPKTIGQRCRSYGILESLDIEKCPASGHWSQQIANDITEEVSPQKVQASFTIDVALPHDDNCGRLLTRTVKLPSPATPTRISAPRQFRWKP